MIAVLFEALPREDRRQAYFDIAEELRPLLAENDGFLSIERFESISTPGKVLSLSFWRDEAAVAAWRQRMEHRQAQRAGRKSVFTEYRLRVAEVVRDYGMSRRDEAPADSLKVHDEGETA